MHVDVTITILKLGIGNLCRVMLIMYFSFYFIQNDQWLFIQKMEHNTPYHVNIVSSG